jgi:hypothetical protein
LAGYYETETGDYCCELCPDEERREELERTSEDKKSSKADVCAEGEITDIKSDSVRSIKTDNDSGHSSEVDEDEDGEGQEEEEDQDLDLGDSGDESRLKNEVENRSHDKKNSAETLNNATISSVGDVSESSVIIDNESNIITDINIVEDLVEETIKVTDQEEIITTNINPVNNNFESLNETETKSPFEEIIDENSNNFKSLVLDGNKNSEAEAVPDVNYPDDMNPFGDEETEDDEQVEKIEVKTEKNSTLNDQQIEVIEKPVTPISTPKPDTSTNPFGSDLDSDEDSSTPVKVTLH